MIQKGSVEVTQEAKITFTSDLDVAVYRKTIRSSLPAVIMPARAHFRWAFGWARLGPTKTLETF